MKSRLIAAAVAVVLGAVGTVVLVSYVRSVSARPASATATQTVEVLVAAATIPHGSDATTLADLVTTKQLPASAVLPDRVTDLDEIGAGVALVDIYPGEQLLLAKFGAAPAGGWTEPMAAPPTMQRITVQLESARALGGRIAAGDTVGVFLSWVNNENVALTHLTIHKVLVTNVQPATGAPSGTEDSAASEAALDAVTPTVLDPTADLLVTLSTTAEDAEQIVWTAEFGKIWLSKEPVTADESGTRIVDGSVVLG